MRGLVPHTAVGRRSLVFAPEPLRLLADLPVIADVPQRVPPGVVIGLGNPLVRDDGVGPAVLRRISAGIRSHSEVEFLELPWAGLSLLEALRGRRWAVIVDCLVSGELPPGTVRLLSKDDVRGSVRLISYHDLNYSTAMDLGRALGWALPDDVLIIGIEGREVHEFGEGLTPEVDAAADEAACIVESFVVEHLERARAS